MQGHQWSPRSTSSEQTKSNTDAENSRPGLGPQLGLKIRRGWGVPLPWIRHWLPSLQTGWAGSLNHFWETFWRCYATAPSPPSICHPCNEDNCACWIGQPIYLWPPTLNRVDRNVTKSGNWRNPERKAVLNAWTLLFQQKDDVPQPSFWISRSAVPYLGSSSNKTGTIKFL